MREIVIDPTATSDSATVAAALPRVVRCVPITQKAAKEWVTKTHRHLKRPFVGDLYRVALEADGVIVAVGVAARPCRMLQDGTTAEFSRLSSVADVGVNACSRLYGALRRAGQALGYRRFVTYTLEHEPGTSLRAAGFQSDGMSSGGEYSRPCRPRGPVEQPGRKRRWIWPCRDSGLWDDVAPGAHEAPNEAEFRLAVQRAAGVPIYVAGA